MKAICCAPLECSHISHSHAWTRVGHAVRFGCANIATVVLVHVFPFYGGFLQMCWLHWYRMPENPQPSETTTLLAFLAATLNKRAKARAGLPATNQDCKPEISPGCLPKQPNPVSGWKAWVYRLHSARSVLDHAGPFGSRMIQTGYFSLLGFACSARVTCRMLAVPGVNLAVHTDRPILSTGAYLDFKRHVDYLLQQGHRGQARLLWLSAVEVLHAPFAQPPLAPCIDAPCVRCDGSLGLGQAIKATYEARDAHWVPARIFSAPAKERQQGTPAKPAARGGKPSLAKPIAGRAVARAMRDGTVLCQAFQHGQCKAGQSCPNGQHRCAAILRGDRVCAMQNQGAKECRAAKKF